MIWGYRDSFRPKNWKTKLMKIMRLYCPYLTNMHNFIHYVISNFLGLNWSRSLKSYTTYWQDLQFFKLKLCRCPQFKQLQTNKKQQNSHFLKLKLSWCPQFKKYWNKRSLCPQIQKISKQTVQMFSIEKIVNKPKFTNI